MRFGVALPQAGPFLAPEVQLQLTTTLESLGYDSLWTSDHIIVPVGESYIPESMHEPLALLSWLAAHTTRVDLGISVLVLPYRDPVFAAKYLASVDVLSGGRVILGVGAGWLKAEFDALSASHVERGAVTDEYLRVIRNLWETETSSFHGRWKHYDDMRLFPKVSAARPAGSTIPITVGGNMAPSIRRAAELGDSWHPINLSPTELRTGVDAYHAQCQRFGRPAGRVILRHMPRGTGSGGPFSGSDAEQQADLAAYAEAGCDELMMSLASRTTDGLLDKLEHFMTKVIRPFQSHDPAAAAG